MGQSTAQVVTEFHMDDTRLSALEMQLTKTT